MLTQTLEKERQEWRAQKHTLPETYAQMVEMEKQKYAAWRAQLEAERVKLEQDMEAERNRLDAELHRVNERQTRIEQQTQDRLMKELDGLAKERDRLESQRMDLMTKNETERARMKQEQHVQQEQKNQLEAQRLAFVEEYSRFQAEKLLFEEQRTAVLEQHALIDQKKHQVMALGQDTFEKTERLAHQMADYDRVKAELDMLRRTHHDMERTHETEKYELQKRLESVHHLRHSLETMSHQMKHDKLLLDQERRQSRHVLHGATQLERLLKCQVRLQSPVQHNNNNQMETKDMELRMEEHDPRVAQQTLNQWLQQHQRDDRHRHRGRR